MVALAARQHAVVARCQLVALRFTRMAIETRLRRATLISVHRSVYGVGQPPRTAESWWMAAILACGTGAVLSHRAAAALHDLRGRPSGEIDVSAPGGHRIPGVSVHIRELTAVRDTVVDAIPVTTVEQTIVDLAPTTPPQRLRTLIENAMRRNAVDFAVVRELACARAGRPGAPNLRGVLAELGDTVPRAHQGLEQRFLELIRAAGLPEPLVNHLVEGYEVDFHWPAPRVIVETDGWRWHQGRRAFEADRRRDAALLAAGWRVLRITNERLLHEPDAVVAELRALLAAQPA
jgi:very-short-patch-repair endonuclease